MIDDEEGCSKVLIKLVQVKMCDEELFHLVTAKCKHSTKHKHQLCIIIIESVNALVDAAGAIAIASDTTEEMMTNVIVIFARAALHCLH